MRNSSKKAELDKLFPLMGLEQGFLISKDADITVGFVAELPELFTVTGEEYESIHEVWKKALRTLPSYTVLHKQDWFMEDCVRSRFNQSSSFLDLSFHRHFNERPFLNHSCYVYLTKTTKQRMHQKSLHSILCRGDFIPKEMTEREGMREFIEAVEQFERIINDEGKIHLRRLSDEDYLGKEGEFGLLDRYLSLGNPSDTVLQDIRLGADECMVGDNRLCFHTLSTPEDLPRVVHTHKKYDRLSTDHSACVLSHPSSVGLLLGCNHIYNQYIFLDDGNEVLERFEKQARNLHSLGQYSRSNQINEAWIQEYLNVAHSLGVSPVRAHFNVMSWSDNPHALKNIKNEVGSCIAMMNCVPRHNTVDAATLYWSGIPGNGADFPWEETFYTFPSQALCLFTCETNYRSSSSPFGIKLCDRLSGVPLHVDISDLPMREGITTNRNKFILGPSGSGKSFFTNHMVRQYYEQGSHVLIVDTGDSYEGLCNLIHARSGGRDGIYYTYTTENPIKFNPFYTSDGVFEVEKVDSIVTLLLTLWKNSDEPIRKTEESEVRTSVEEYIHLIKHDESIVPCLNTYYEYVRDIYKPSLGMRNIPVSSKEFDVNNYLTALIPFYKGGMFDFLLNSSENIDLLEKRFVIFEIDSIKDNKALFPIVTIIIMEAFINKMRRLKDVRKVILIEEAWKAIASANMADYVKYLYKTVRKHFGEAIVVTQEIDDIIHSPIVKESIINNSDCKILLDQRKYMNRFQSIQEILGLSEKEKQQILSINQNNDSYRKYKEVWIGLGGVRSAVYATEVSMEEYLTYTTESAEKVEVKERAAALGGDYEQAIKMLAQEKRNALSPSGY